MPSQSKQASTLEAHTEGVWEVILDGRTSEARIGSVIYCPRQTSHGFCNIGTTTGKMIWFSTPGSAVERLFEELGTLPADAPPNMQMELLAQLGLM